MGGREEKTEEKKRRAAAAVEHGDHDEKYEEPQQREQRTAPASCWLLQFEHLEYAFAFFIPCVFFFFEKETHDKASRSGRSRRRSKSSTLALSAVLLTRRVVTCGNLRTTRTARTSWTSTAWVILRLVLLL